MKLEKMIEKLQEMQKVYPDAIVRFGDILGPDISPRIYCFECVEEPKFGIVCLCDSKSELDMMFSQYYGKLRKLGVTEELFYSDLLKDFTLEDIERYVPQRYNHAKEFCEKHGLVWK